jgi:CheY-like chemotaxis protein
VSFSDSHAALAAFEAAPGQFHVVISDEVMPGLTGTGLARVVSPSAGLPASLARCHASFRSDITIPR